MNRPRLQSIDLLRGIVMVIMALDHVRDFFHADAQLYSPEDLAHTTGAIFFTRWITHFCAPVFVFLAGTGSYLALRRRNRPGELSRFLWTRGLWLIFGVEMFFVAAAINFRWPFQLILWQVIWAIGWSMIALAALIHVPWRTLLAGSLAMIALHNTLDGVKPEAFGSLAWLWQILHVPFAFFPLPGGVTAMLLYPLIPWVAVMSAGYCFGRVYDLEPERRRRFLWKLGAGLTVGFFALRFTNWYGDPSPWSWQSTTELTVISFFRATKYPPSLVYLLMTLGPAILVLAALDRTEVSDRNPFLAFGRVPMFYYLLHFNLIHAVMAVLAWFRYGRMDFVFQLPKAINPNAAGFPADYGYSLGETYLIWIGVVAVLYWPCRWFVDVKRRNRSAWLSYF
ncbi:MAG: heparan-alpha-glucosaminide N-acetyltransferase domain-containing protein [Acidobacteriota bacterium]